MCKVFTLVLYAMYDCESTSDCSSSKGESLCEYM